MNITHSQFDALFANEDDRLARIDRLVNTSTNKQLEKLDNIKRCVELAIARNYGNQISQTVVDRLLNGLILRSEVICAIGGTLDDLPQDKAGWASYVQKIISEDPLARLNLVTSTENNKESMRTRFLNSVSPEERITMARNGYLDDYLDSMVEEEINRQLEILQQGNNHAVS